MSEYRRLPLDELIRLIGREADSNALREFHGHRTLFRIKGYPPLLFVKFVEATLRGEDVADARKWAYDLTIDKFLSLPTGTTDANTNGSKARGTNCRHYFKMLARSIDAWKEANVGADTLALEAAAARLTQRHVARHCRLSLLEANRSLRCGRSRYSWRLPSGSFCVWMPCSVTGAERRKWLETHVPEADASRAGEQQRVQAIVDAYWGTTQTQSFDERLHVPKYHTEAYVDCESIVEEQIGVRGLAAFVAEEKALRLTEQRPALRRLGMAGLEALIRRIFNDLSSGCLEDQIVARDFGLSKATFSRFAGSRWRTDGPPPPDLWRNLARALACVPSFVVAAKNAGVSNIVRCVVAAQVKKDAGYE